MDSNERERRRQRRYREAMRNRGIAAVVLVILIVGTLTYIPFVLMSNRMAEKEAQKEQ